MSWIMIGSAVIGGVAGIAGANKTSKSMDAATQAKMAGFNQYKPYVDANLAGGSGALDGVLSKGAYTGQTYAGPNDFQTGTANTMGGYGMGMQGSGFGMMGDNSGFGANSNSIYNQFQGMSEDAKNDRLGTAMDYASANSGSLVDSAMFKDRQNLQENTLTGIDLAASNSGNMNSSRAGVAEAVANRGYEDRRANVAMDIQDRLIDRSLDSQARQFADQGNSLTSAMNANSGISDAYKTGMNTMGEGANFGMNAGNSLQGYNQAGLDDARRRFEEDRDFELQKRTGYQSGMLGKSPNSSQNVTANTMNPYAAGVGGAMQGFGYAKQYMDSRPQPSVAPQYSPRPRMRQFGVA
jgi:hypothetical protein